ATAWPHGFAGPKSIVCRLSRSQSDGESARSGESNRTRKATAVMLSVGNHATRTGENAGTRPGPTNKKNARYAQNVAAPTMRRERRLSVATQVPKKANAMAEHGIANLA